MCTYTFPWLRSTSQVRHLVMRLSRLSITRGRCEQPSFIAVDVNITCSLAIDRVSHTAYRTHRRTLQRILYETCIKFSVFRFHSFCSRCWKNYPKLCAAKACHCYEITSCCVCYVIRRRSLYAPSTLAERERESRKKRLAL